MELLITSHLRVVMIRFSYKVRAGLCSSITNDNDLKYLQVQSDLRDKVATVRNFLEIVALPTEYQSGLVNAAFTMTKTRLAPPYRRARLQSNLGT